MVSVNVCHDPHSPGVHLAAGIVAGLMTTTVTNPIWVVKTQAQLMVQVSEGGRRPAGASALSVLRSIWRTEGFFGFFRGVSASYIGEQQRSASGPIADTTAKRANIE